MKILLTNDDGVISTGIQIMSRLLSDKGWLSAVIAPDRERSGTGHSITVGYPVRVHPLDPGMFSPGISAYSCDGTPTDCARARAPALSDIFAIAEDEGPMKAMSRLRQMSAKWPFSERKPYPGWMASTLEISAAEMMEGMWRYERADSAGPMQMETLAMRTWREFLSASE